MEIANTINQFYSKFPSPIKIYGQRFFNRIPNAFIYGGSYRQLRASLENSQHCSKDEIRAKQFSELKRIISEYYAKSRFYSRFYAKHGFSPEHLKDWSDIEKIPLIDKSIVRTQTRNLSIPLPFREIVFLSHTGGTSSPMFFPETMKARIFERAFVDRFYSWHGLDEEEPKVTLKGIGMMPGQSWFYSPFLKSTVLPFLEISIEQLKKYAPVIQRIKPKAFVFSYPSLVYSYARAIKKGFVPKPASIKMIFCSSEVMLPYQKEEIEEVFGVVPISYYGQNEKVSLIQECPYHESHVIPEYGITEILDQENKHVTEEGQIGEIVGTGFLNRAFLLIRYKTEDFAIKGPDRACPCGLPYDRVINIEGRSGDFLRTDNGIFLSPAMLEFTVDHMSHITDIQLVQTSIHQVNILLCPDVDFEEKDAEELVMELRKRTKDRIKFELKIVDSIARPLNAKKRLIISELDQSASDFFET